MSDLIQRLNTALDGRYRVERELGEGGMATVYLADDLRHERKVALKVLKSELAAVVGAERFLAEIKTTANLHHPHILPLFDSGETDGFLFYVMPYIEGETLRDRIDRDKQLPVEEAVSLAASVANALQHAHDRGVIHRDIKPGNILLQDGQPLVADFGIALAVGAAGGSRLTETGLSVGTPYYMSPEQATGDQALGPASDVYGLAAVLYEMLTGDPPYIGSTAQAVLGKIIQGEPVSATQIRKAVPPNVDAAIRKALEKLPADRFSGAQDFARALIDPSFRHGETAAAGVAAGATPWKGVSIALASLLLLNVGWTLSRAEPRPLVTRQLLSTDGWAGLAAPVGRLAALAPDGSSMILPVQSGDQLALGLKMRGSAEITPLADTEGALDVVYSPDAQWIAYATGGELRTRSLIGGAPVTLAEDLEDGNRVSLDWLEDRTIVYEQILPNGRQIVRIPEAGGDPIQVVWPEAVVAPIWIRGLPDARGALVIDCEGLAVACDGTRSRLHVVDLRDLSSQLVLEQVIAAWYVPTGHIVYVRADGSVFAQPFHLGALELVGSRIPLFDGVRAGANFADLHLAADGTLLYVEGQAELAGFGRTVMWVDRSGAETVVDPGWPPAVFQTVALSPDGQRLAVTITTEDEPGDLWVKVLPDGPLTRLTTDQGYARYPAWSPDGATIAYTTDEGGTYEARTVRSDGSSIGDYEVLLESEQDVYEVAFTADGQGIVFREGTVGGGGNADLGIVTATGSQGQSLLASEFNEAEVALSRDGRWLAYTTNVTGRNEVFVRPFPSIESGSVQVSAGGGREPVWAHNGRELFYREPQTGSLMAATYQAEPTFTVQSRERLFDASPYRSAAGWHHYDVTSDDERFVMIRNSGATAGEAGGGRLILVQNWLEELRERVGGN